MRKRSWQRIIVCVSSHFSNIKSMQQQKHIKILKQSEGQVWWKERGWSPQWGQSQVGSPSQGHLGSEARRQIASWKIISLIILTWSSWLLVWCQKQPNTPKTSSNKKYHMICFAISRSIPVTDEQTLQSKHHRCKPIIMIMVANIIIWISRPDLFSTGIGTAKAPSPSPIPTKRPTSTSL